MNTNVPCGTQPRLRGHCGGEVCINYFSLTSSKHVRKVINRKEGDYFITSTWVDTMQGKESLRGKKTKCILL